MLPDHHKRFIHCPRHAVLAAKEGPQTVLLPASITVSLGVKETPRRRDASSFSFSQEMVRLPERGMKTDCKQILML